MPDRDERLRRWSLLGRRHDRVDRCVPQPVEMHGFPVAAQLAVGEEGIERSLGRDEGHGAAQIQHRGAELAQRLRDPLARPRIAWVERGDDDDRLAAQRLRERRDVRQAPQHNIGAEILGGGGHEVAPAAEDVPRLGQRVDRRAEEDLRPDRVKAELERGHHPEVAAAAAHGPEEVGVLVRAGGPQPAIGGDDVDRDEVVAAEAMLSAQMAVAAAQREARDPGGRDVAVRRGEAEDLRLAIDIAPGRATSDAHRARARIDANAAHRGQVDHQAAIADGAPGDVVPPAAHRDRQVMVAREIDRCDDVGSAGAAGDHAGMPVDHAVPDAAGRVVVRVAGAQQLAAQIVAKWLDRCIVDQRGPAVHGLHVCPLVCATSVVQRLLWLR